MVQRSSVDTSQGKTSTMDQVMQIESWDLARLRGHPENAIIFGDPEEADEYEGIKADIKKRGICEPIVVKADGVIVSGHLRRAIAEQLGLKSVPVRIVPAFSSYREELEYIVRSNTERRHLSKQQLALAFKRLRETPRAQGGTSGGKGGRPRKGAERNLQSGAQVSRGDEDAAELLNIGVGEARALETVFTTEGVPDEVKRAVNAGVVKPTPAAKAIREEAKKQGGEVKDPAPLMKLVQPKPPKEKSPHEEHVDHEAARYLRDQRELLEAYKAVDRVLTRRPLKSVAGATEHQEYAQLCRDVALRAWREIESVQGPTNAGRQMQLVALDGGRK